MERKLRGAIDSTKAEPRSGAVCCGQATRLFLMLSSVKAGILPCLHRFDPLCCWQVHIHGQLLICSDRCQPPPLFRGFNPPSPVVAYPCSKHDETSSHSIALLLTSTSKGVPVAPRYAVLADSSSVSVVKHVVLPCAAVDRALARECLPPTLAHAARDTSTLSTASTQGGAEAGWMRDGQVLQPVLVSS